MMSLADLGRLVASDPEKYANKLALLFDGMGRYGERDEVMALYDIVRGLRAALTEARKVLVTACGETAPYIRVALKRLDAALAGTADERGSTVIDNRHDFELWAQKNIGQYSREGRYVRDGRWVYNHNIQQLCWEAWTTAVQMTEFRQRAPDETKREPRQ